MDAQTIIEMLNTDAQTKAEVNALMDKWIDILKERVVTLGTQREARIKRSTESIVRAEENLNETLAENDQLALLATREIDCIHSIQLKLTGNHPEPIAVPEDDVIEFEKPKSRRMWGRS